MNKNMTVSQTAEAAVAAETGLPVCTTSKDAIKAGLNKLMLHYPYLLKGDADDVRERNRDYALVLADQEPMVIALAVLEWLSRANDYAPRPGQWRDYCQRIEDEIRQRCEYVRYVKGVWETAQARRAERGEWVRHLTLPTRRYIEIRRHQHVER